MFRLDVKTNRKVEFIDVTGNVQQVVSREGVEEGVCYLFVPHTTAGITINENADPSVVRDIAMALSKLVDPMSYEHVEGNSPAHVKSSMVGCSLTIPVENGKLALGTWQGIYFCEFDGPRSRKLYVNVLKLK
jgi:secondary thiamine-phosphate synthase enzyme